MNELPVIQKNTRKLSIIASKGTLDMALAAMVLANAARMEGIETHLFFTFWGLDIITKKKLKKLGVAVVGNPSMHPAFHIPSWVGIIPGMAWMASWMMRREIAKLDVPPMDEFLGMVMDAGAHVYGCKMTVDMFKLTKADLVDGAQILGATDFMEISEGAQIIFI
jgi:peroxiredoxin family protein